MKLSRRRFLTLLGLSLISTTVPRINAQGRQVAVIGAGAAGLAAARQLQAAGFGVVVIEARDRIGGRTVTSYDLAPHPVELGAEFIHGDEVPTWDLLEEFNLDETLDTFEDEEAFAFYVNGRLYEYPDWLRLEGIDLIEAIDEEIAWEDEDLSIAEWLETDIPRVVNNVMASDNAADLDELGVQGYVETTYAGDGEGDFRIAAGYTRLIEAMAAGLDIRLSSPVQRIERAAGGATVVTSREVFSVDAVVVTLPLGVLQAGDVVFDPPLPRRKLDAINRLGAGKVNKLILKFDAPFWDDGIEVLATELDTQLWWRPGWGRRDEAPILTALIGGDAGARFSEMTEAEAIQAGLNDLQMMSGIDDLAGRLVEGRFINWGADPYSKMGYSYVPVGAAGMRAIFAEPLDNVLYFAGEATNITHPATVHGAFMSGWRAAREIINR